MRKGLPCGTGGTRRPELEEDDLPLNSMRVWGVPSMSLKRNLRRGRALGGDFGRALGRQSAPSGGEMNAKHERRSPIGNHVSWRNPRRAGFRNEPADASIELQSARRTRLQRVGDHAGGREPRGVVTPRLSPVREAWLRRTSTIRVARTRTAGPRKMPRSPKAAIRRRRQGERPACSDLRIFQSAWPQDVVGEE